MDHLDETDKSIIRRFAGKPPPLGENLVRQYLAGSGIRISVSDAIALALGRPTSSQIRDEAERARDIGRQGGSKTSDTD